MGRAIHLPLVLVSFVITLFFQNCGAPEHAGDSMGSATSINGYEDLFNKVISVHCLQCHSGATPDGDMDFSSYDQILASGAVVPGNAAVSPMYLEVASGRMPQSGVFPQTYVNAIAEWIDSGARDSSGAAANEVPMADAGNDISLVLPVNTVTLSGTASDNDGSISSVHWNQLSGPGSAVFSDSQTLTPVVSNLSEGFYTFLLEVRDNEDAVSSDTVLVSVILPVNAPPTVNAGPDQSVTDPTSTINLSGSASDSDGTVTTTIWTQISGPSTANIQSPNSLPTNVVGLTANGTYEFQLMATDNSGDSTSDTVKVTRNPDGNLLPTANAGADRTLTLPQNSLTLIGSASDSDGTITAWEWSQLSGPNNAVFSGANTTTLSVSALVEGQYQFQFKVTDNLGGEGTDLVFVTVAPVPAAPTFTQVNQQVFGPRCLECHSGSAPKGSYSMESWSQIMSQVVAGDAESSDLYLKVKDNSMPKKPKSPLDTDQKNLIRDWINAGALNN